MKGDEADESHLLPKPNRKLAELGCDSITVENHSRAHTSGEWYGMPPIRGADEIFTCVDRSESVQSGSRTLQRVLALYC